MSQITKELQARYQAFRARSLREVQLLVLFLDAFYLPTRPNGAKEGVLVARGCDETETSCLSLCCAALDLFVPALEGSG